MRKNYENTYEFDVISRSNSRVKNQNDSPNARDPHATYRWNTETNWNIFDIENWRSLIVLTSVEILWDAAAVEYKYILRLTCLYSEETSLTLILCFIKCGLKDKLYEILWTNEARWKDRK